MSRPRTVRLPSFPQRPRSRECLTRYFQPVERVAAGLSENTLHLQIVDTPARNRVLFPSQFVPAPQPKARGGAIPFPHKAELAVQREMPDHQRFVAPYRAMRDTVHTSSVPHLQDDGPIIRVDLPDTLDERRPVEGLVDRREDARKRRSPAAPRHEDRHPVPVQFDFVLICAPDRRGVAQIDLGAAESGQMAPQPGARPCQAKTHRQSIFRPTSGHILYESVADVTPPGVARIPFEFGKPNFNPTQQMPPGGLQWHIQAGPSVAIGAPVQGPVVRVPPRTRKISTAYTFRSPAAASMTVRRYSRANSGYARSPPASIHCTVLCVVSNARSLPPDAPLSPLVVLVLPVDHHGVVRQRAHGPGPVPRMGVSKVRHQLFSKRIQHQVQHVRVVVSVAAFREMKVRLRLAFVFAQPEPRMTHPGKQRRTRPVRGFQVLESCPGIVYRNQPSIGIPEDIENPCASFNVGEFAKRVQIDKAPAVFRVKIAGRIGVSGQGFEHAHQA